MRTLFFYLLLFTNVCLAGIADRKYLIDKKLIDQLEPEERKFVDSSISIYHNTNDEYKKNLVISNLVEIIGNANVWHNYNLFLINKVKNKKDLSSRKFYDKTLNNLGFYYDNVLNNPERAKYYYLIAIKNALQNKDTIILIEANINLASIEKNKLGSSKQASIYYKIALYYASLSKDYNRMAIALNGFGVISSQLGNYVDAINTYSKAHTIFIKLNNTDDACNALNNMAIIFAKLNQNDLAYNYYMKAETIYKKNRNYNNLALVYNNIANLFITKSNFDSAYTYILLAEKYYKISNNDFDIPLVYQKMGNFFYHKKMYDSTIFYCKKCINMANSAKNENVKLYPYHTLYQTYLTLGNIKLSKQYIDSTYIIYNKKNLTDESFIVFKGQYKINKLLKNEEKALFFLEKLRDAENVQKGNDLRNALSKQIFKTEYEVKEQKYVVEELKQKQKLKTQRIVLYSMFLGLFLLLSVIFLVLKNLKTVKKTQQIISEQKNVIEQKNIEVKDSIDYANKIQTVLMTGEQDIANSFSDYFIYYKPKDIVSGDFYFATQLNNCLYYVIGDCTGHGVPGAFMSLLSISYIQEAINSESIVKTNLIFEYVKNKLSINLKSKEGINARDGMDAVIFCFNKKTKILTFTAANNTPVIFRDEEIITFKPDKMPVGYSDNINLNFTEQTFQLKSNDVVYAFTDGYIDQFGGINNKKFLKKNLLTILSQNIKLPMKEQQTILNDTFDSWTANTEQIDDILITGFKIT